VSSLFEIGRDLEAVLATVDDGGEMPPELEVFFAGLQAEEADKLDRYCGLIAALEMECRAATEQAAYWRAKADTRSNAVERLKRLLKDHLSQTGRAEARTATGRKIKIIGNGGTAPLEIDAGLVPAAYQKAVYQADRDAIRRELENGAEFGFARLGERGSHLRIY